MSNRDILSSLRQMHFPDCVRSALDYLSSVSIHKSSSCSVPAGQVEAVNSQIVSEFIFFLHVKKVSSYRRSADGLCCRLLWHYLLGETRGVGTFRKVRRLIVASPRLPSPSLSSLSSSPSFPFPL